MQRPVDEDIRKFIDLFDGDASAAIASINELTNLQQRPPTRPLREVSGETIVSIENLQKQYKLGKQRIDALNGVSLDIQKGEFVALTGPSGSGKSTLLQLIGGLDKPTGGTIEITGKQINQMKDKELSQFRGQTIGFVFQFFYLQPFLTLGTNVQVPAMFANKDDRNTRTARARLLVDNVGLSERVDHLPKELSGGQMQRAAIARALMNNPSILLADEPTGNLDSTNSQAIVDLFEKIRDEYGTTVIIVTHDAAIARRADREIRLRDGVVV